MCNCEILAFVLNRGIFIFDIFLIPGCSEKCSLGQFIQLVKPMTISSRKDWRKLCQLSDDDENKGFNSIIIILSSSFKKQFLLCTYITP